MPSSFWRSASARFLQFILECLLLLREHFGVDRRSVEGLAETGERQLEGDFRIGLVLDRNVEGRALLQLIDRRPLHFRFGETTVREADLEFAVYRSTLIHREAQPGLQQQTDRHEHAHDALILALDVIYGQGQSRLLVGGGAEIAGRIANVLVGRLVMAADLGPIGLHADERNLTGTGRLRLARLGLRRCLLRGGLGWRRGTLSRPRGLRLGKCHAAGKNQTARKHSHADTLE